MGDIVSALDATNLHQDSIKNRGKYITRLLAQERGPNIPSIWPRPALKLSTLVPNLQALNKQGQELYVSISGILTPLQQTGDNCGLSQHRYQQETITT
ncbi:thrB [Acrasis kona]|uniref:ThrB n=1 Tax=Acrasis kona TaxID=1008807 RepID=A0AAW2ZHM6_9EUKA